MDEVEQATHSPGPWTMCLDGTRTGRWFTIIGRLNYYDDGSAQEIARTDTVAVNDSVLSEEAWIPTELGTEIEANARLIASAPELLSSLETIVKLIRWGTWG